MNLICLDTETTGLNSSLDRIIEIGCVDITNGFAQRKIFHTFVNPERDIPIIASKIHGITSETIKDALIFQHHASEFLKFIQDSTLIIHNSSFDLKFLNAELSRCNLPNLTNNIIDTLKLSKSKFPGQKASLDALMKKFKISVEREKHGALLDAEILAQIYIAMTKNQSILEVKKENFSSKKEKANSILISISDEELTQNKKFFEEKIN